MTNQSKPATNQIGLAVAVFSLQQTSQCYKLHNIILRAEVGTNNIISKAQRNKAQRSFQPVKAQRKLRNLFFLISEAQRNFRNEFFDSVDVQRNSAIAERHFRTKLKRNLTSAIEISQHRANTALFAIFDRKE